MYYCVGNSIYAQSEIVSSLCMYYCDETMWRYTKYINMYVRVLYLLFWLHAYKKILFLFMHCVNEHKKFKIIWIIFNL